jgi:hypothetical protein
MNVNLHGKIMCTEVHKNQFGDEMVYFKDGPIVRQEATGTAYVPGFEIQMTIANPQCHGWYQQGKTYSFNLSHDAGEPVDELPAPRATIIAPATDEDAEDAAPQTENEEVED